MPFIKVLEQKEGALQLDERSEIPWNEKEVYVKVHYSSINYKDALAVTGKGRILKSFPMIPGIDAAGVVVKSNSLNFPVGAKVLVNGSGFGETRDGGFSNYLNSPEDLLVRVEERVDLKECMLIGTAGYTAALALHQMRKNDLSSDKPILITGASGGVGSLATLLFSQAGYEVHALSSKKDKQEYLYTLGATKVLSFEELSIPEKSPALGKAMYSGVVDNIGGEAITKLLPHIDLFGSFASIGLASSHSFESTVMPHILRGVNILGISSANSPMNLRRKIWNDLFMSTSFLNSLKSLEFIELALKEVPSFSEKLLDRKISGRCIVSL